MGRFRTTLLSLLALVVVAAAAVGVVGWRTDRLDDWWHDLRGDTTVAGPAAVAAPKGVDAPDVVRPAAVAQGVDLAVRPKRAKVAAVLQKVLRKGALGKHVLAAVGPLRGSAVTYRYDSSGTYLATPASTTKLVTTTAALFALGPTHTFKTTTVLSGSGSSHRLTLVGGGDPYLEASPTDPAEGPTYDLHRADLATLAARTATALKNQGVHKVRLGFDDSLFSGPSTNPRWEPGYVPSGEVAPTSALWVDEGHPVLGASAADPALAATQVFRAALVKRGIKVLGAPVHAVAPTGASPVASVSSAPLAQIVQRILQVSDNDGAEVLLRQVGVAEAGQGSFAAGRQAVRKILAANSISMHGSVLYDGSGLSRHDLMSPELLLDVLRLDASQDHPGLRPVIEGLPVTGFNGSLVDASGGPSASGWGRARAKTGTLTGVTALAGVAVDADGTPMAFVVMADRIPSGKDGLARQWRDEAAAALGACHCS